MQLNIKSNINNKITNKKTCFKPLILIENKKINLIF